MPGISIDEISASVSETRQPNQVSEHEIPKVVMEQVKDEGGTVVPGAVRVDVSDSDDDSHVEGENETHILQWRKTKSEGETFNGYELVGNIDILQYMKDQTVQDDEILTVRYMDKEYQRKGSMSPKRLQAVSWGARIRKINDADLRDAVEKRKIDGVDFVAALDLENIIRKRKRSKRYIR